MDNTKHRHLDEKSFLKLKTLMEAGIKGTQVAKLMGYSDSLVYTANKFDNLSDYLSCQKERQLKYRSTKLPEEKEVVLITSPIVPPMPFPASNERIISLLISINNGIQLLADKLDKSSK